jgi:hypothetical protein
MINRIKKTINKTIPPISRKKGKKASISSYTLLPEEVKAPQYP